MGEMREYWDPWRGFGFDARLNFSFFDLVSLKNRVMFKWDDWASGNLIKGFEGILYYGRLDVNMTDDGLNGINPFIAEGTEKPLKARKQKKPPIDAKTISIYSDFLIY